MKILVHDYSGHPFQVQLTRELARRGHEARHVFSASFQTPKGNLTVQPGDPKGFSITPVKLDVPFQKENFFKRRFQEIEIGKLIAREIESFAPDIVVSSNAPLDCQRMIWNACEKNDIAKVFWLQDIYSEAILTILSRKIPVAGAGIGHFYKRIEFNLLRRADHVVSITDDFGPVLTQHGIDADRITTIENWAPLNELDRAPYDNDWARANMNADRPRIVYSGTLGLKHNPDHLREIAESVPEADVYVFSEGPSAEALKKEAAEKNLPNLQVRPWVSFADLPKMLSGADLMVVLLEDDAGIYSVPSKLLTYCCMGRPVIGAIPEGNLARRIIERNEFGLVSKPGDTAPLLANVKELLADPDRRTRYGENARAYAEEKFDIGKITDQFEAVFATLPASRTRAAA